MVPGSWQKLLNVKLRKPTLALEVSTYEPESGMMKGNIVSNMNRSDKNESRATYSILDKMWESLCIYSWLMFITFELSIGLDRIYSEHPLCPYTAREYGPVYWHACFACLGGFILILCLLIIKVVQLKGGKKIPLSVSINIVSMGTIATALNLFIEWGGTCIDGLGVASPGAIWGKEKWYTYVYR